MHPNLDLTVTIYLLRRQLSNGIHTMSPCANDCGESAIGGRDCAKCLQGHLATLIGNDKAQAAVISIKNSN